MIDRTTKLRWRRTFKRRQRQLEDIGYSTEEQLDRHFFRRLGRLYDVRRYLVTWTALVLLLISGTVLQFRSLGNYYLKVQPVEGGIYSEGIVGSFTNANPIFATTEVDTTVSRLVFSSLFNYSQRGELAADLADTISVDATGKVYTVKLKPGINWHDGTQFSAQDVVFTFQTIQNPDAKSPLLLTWQGIKVAALDEKTVTFTLPNVLASFPQSLTTGILPKHLLEGLAPESLRSASFNTTAPIGTGPFAWNEVEVRGTEVADREQRMSFVPFEDYFRGKPKLNEFILRTFLDEARMSKSFANGELTAMAGVEDLLEEQRNSVDFNDYNIPMNGVVMTFYRTSQDVLKDVKVRRALTAAVNIPNALQQLNYPSINTRGPLLKGMIGYDGVSQQGFDEAKANSLLDEAGWVKGDKGFRFKDGKKLSLVLDTLNNVEYAVVAGNLQKQWARVGVDVSVQSLNQRDLQTAISSRSYDILLYGITLGTDPDQFAYWHGSQADSRVPRRLNFSDYSSSAANAALEAGRTRIDPVLRAAKYKPFLDAWRNDVPAMSMYQPRFLYVTKGTVYNFNPKKFTSPSDRYSNVFEWMVRTSRVSE